MADGGTAPGATLLARMQADQAAARRAQDKLLVLLLGMVISETRNREIELKRDVVDDDVVEVIRKAIKRRKESVALYEKAGRTDLSEKEAAEAMALEKYLPAAVDPDELKAAVTQAIADGANNVGMVMARVMPQFKGRADGATINAIAREALAGRK